MDRRQLLKKLDERWTEFNESYAGLADSEMTESGVTGDWSVKDIIAHVTWWEEEALKHLPIINEGGRPRTYAAEYGGINAFNALMTEQKRRLPLSDVLRARDETHHRLVIYIERAPEGQFTSDTRFRRRLRLDTYNHYPKHARAIRAWRRQSAGEAGRRFEKGKRRRMANPLETQGGKTNTGVAKGA
jgi:hypothetical protein